MMMITTAVIRGSSSPFSGNPSIRNEVRKRATIETQGPSMMMIRGVLLCQHNMKENPGTPFFSFYSCPPKTNSYETTKDGRLLLMKVTGLFFFSI